MPPRRKKAADEGATPEEGALEAAPKKRRVARKSAVKKGVTIEKSPTPSIPIPPEPKIPPIIDIAPKPVAAPSPAVTPPPKPSFGTDIPIRTVATEPRITIEPEVHRGENDVQDDWPPLRKGDADLTAPPKVLLQSKRVPKPEVEDILEEPDEERETERMRLRPSVKTSLYRKIAVGFAFLALVVGGLVMYVAYARALVTVHPRRVAVETERVLLVTEAATGETEIPGEIAEVTVAGERTGTPAEATVTDGVATGMVTLINRTDNDQTLVATTRLLTPDGILFRLKSRVNVPAQGRLTTEVYADRPGAEGDIGPSTFIIPGLPTALQDDIYAESDAAMKGGRVSTGIISQADIDTVEKGLRAELETQAKEELERKLEGEWTGRAYEIDDMSRFVTAAPGETADGVSVRLTLRVRMAAFDREKAVTIAGEDLKRALTSDRELIGVSSETAKFSLEDADPKAGTASLRAVIRGESRVSLGNPLFDASKLRGLDLDDVRAYFEGIEGVERVEVKFRPFWIKRMPDLADHIEFKIEK